MKKRSLMLLIALSATALLIGCGKKKEAAAPVEVEEPVIEIGGDEPEPAPAPEVVEEEPVVEEEEEEEVREGYYRSELTNEWIDESIKNQRPIAAMVDNEKTALDHYGVNDCDIVYEMTNSTQNDGITRLMCIMKDWGNIKRLGSIRSVRPTNLQIAPEYGAVVCHDGGPFYIDLFLKNAFVQHFSGTFSRVDNGKSREFTEYIMPGDLEKNFKNANLSTEYDPTYYTAYHENQKHFNFVSEKKPEDLSSYGDAKDANKIKLPFKHNGSYLEYDSENGVYKYGEYGSAHIDAANGNTQTSFKNCILQRAELKQLDEHGYMQFYVDPISDQKGYYITNGKCIPITWSKADDISFTRFFDMNGNEIKMNTGKTYIAIIREEAWDDIEIN